MPLTYQVEIDSLPYTFKLSSTRTNISISITSNSSFIPATYECNYTQSEISKEVPFFTSFTSLDDIKECIISLFESKHYSLELNKDHTVCCFSLSPASEGENKVKIFLKQYEVDKDVLIKDLHSCCIKMSNQIDILNKKLKYFEQEYSTQDQWEWTNKKIEKLSVKLHKLNTINIHPNEDQKYLERIKTVLSNNILVHSEDEKGLIRWWITNNDTTQIKMSLLYKATIDSDFAGPFHEKCDNHSPTFVIVKTDQGIRFGGYTTKTWNCDVDCKEDPQAFLFSLDMKAKYMIRDGEKTAIYCHPNYGPTFGAGFDLCLSNNFMGCAGSYSNFPYSYGSGSGKNEMTMKNKNFNISDVEVYQIDFWERGY